MRKIEMMFAVLFVTSLIVIGCTKDLMEQEGKAYNESSSQEYALQVVQNMPEFQNYGGTNLILLGSNAIEYCDGCWRFTYRFDADADNITGYIVSIPIQQGQIGEVGIHKVYKRPDLVQEICTASGGNWNTCGSRCQLDNQGVEGAACTMQCELLCECGGIAGFTCPEDYVCKMPSSQGLMDAIGYCE